MEKKLLNILDIVERLLKWKKLLVINFLILAVVSVIFSMIVPRWYRSSATLLSPESEVGGLNIASMITSALPVGGMLGGAVSEEATRFLAIINSRTMMEDIAIKFDLQKRFKTKNIELTVKALRKRVSADINEDGTVTISTMMKTPFFWSKQKEDETRAITQQMTSYIVKRLDEFNIQLKGESATEFRKFIEKRYLQNLQDLEIAEDKLKEFQKETGIVSLEDQTLATIKNASDLKAKITLKEIELDVLKKYYDQNHAKYQEAKTTLEVLNKKYSELCKENPKILSDDKDVLIQVNQIPDLGTQYLRYFRDIKLQESILEFILPQYEQAKIQEQKEIPTLQILDDANYPIRKAKPKRAFIVLFVTAFGMLLSIILVWLIEQMNEYRNNNSQTYARLLKIKQMLK